MPAVQLIRLKTQINELTWKFTRPDEFQHGLRNLLEFYSNRVIKPGRAISSTYRIQTYHTPAIVINQLELELEPFVRENPGAALSLADSLWNDDYLEPRILAVSLLSMMPGTLFDEVIQRAREWPEPERDAKSLAALARNGLGKLRRENQDRWFEVVLVWLESTPLFLKRLGLQALLPAVQEKDFANLPPIFQMIYPLVEHPLPQLQAELVELLQALAKRTPSETIFFLKHMVGLSGNPEMIRVVRRVLPVFDAELQTGLRNYLAGHAKPGR